MNNNQKKNILMSKNIRLTIMEYFDAYICHHYRSRLTNDDKYMHRNLPELIVFIV